MTDTTPPTDAPLYVLGVKAERFMYVDVMELSFSTSGITQFSGPNNSGKTDALRALESTLLGDKFIPEMPVQAGSDRAETEMSIGGADGKPTLLAKRVYRDGGNGSFQVRDADGTKRGSPQSVMDELVNSRFLNPVKWATPNLRTPKADNEYRLEVLFQLCPLAIDLPKHDAAMAALAEELKPVNKRIKDLTAVVTDAAATGAPDGPEEDESGLVGEIAALDASAELRSRAGKRAEELGREIDEAEKEIARLQAKVKMLTEEWTRQGNLSQAKGAADPAPLRERLAAIRERNAKRRAAVADRARADERARQLLAERTRASEIDATLKRMDGERDAAIKAAKFPIPNLTISSDGWLSVRKKETGLVVPFHQENTAKRILAAFIIFAATKPKLRAFIVPQGNDLDHDSLMALAKLSKRFGIVVFLERIVGDPEAGAVIEFRAGKVVRQEPERAAP